jgi:hypothetical protein
MIIPDKSKTIIIEGEGTDLSELPLNELPYRASDGTIKGSGLRMLSSGTLLAPIGFAVESGSVDFGDVIRLSESASYLGIQNMIDKKQYQLLDYAVPRDSASLPPFRFYLKEAEKRFNAVTDESNVITSNPLVFDYTTQLTARTNAIIYKASQKMENVRLCIKDKASGVALKYFPSKASWVTGQNGTTFDVGENVLDFQDTALIFQAGTPITFEIQANNVSLVGGTLPWFSGFVQEGQYIRIADVQDINNLQTQINNIPSSFNGSYLSLTDVPTSFPPSQHTHVIADINGLQNSLSSLQTAVNGNSSSISGLSLVASTGQYQDLLGKPTIPFAVSQLSNDLGFVTLNHTHPISQIEGLQTALDGKQSSSGNISVSRITGLSTVAISGSYLDLSNKPVFPTNISSFNNDSGYITLSQIPSISISWSDVQNKPTSFTPAPHQHPISDVVGLQNALNGKMDANSSISYNSLTDRPVLFSGKYNDLSGKPVLFSGSYSDLSNKPVYALVASTGSYNDLSDKPTIPTVNYPVLSVAGKTGNVLLSSSDISGLSSVASSGSYNDLTNKPNIPAAQVNSDWNSSSGISQILNKPTLFSGSWNDLTNKPSTFTPSAHAHVISDVTNLQSTLDTKITSASLPITRRSDNSLVSRVKVKYYTVVSDSTSAIWTVNLGTDFTEVLDVQVQPVSIANTIAGIRQATLNAYTSTSTSVTGITYGNNVITSVLITLGANALQLLPSTTVRVRVEGIGS